MPPVKESDRLTKIETQYDFILTALGELKAAMFQSVSKADFEQFRREIMDTTTGKHNALAERLDTVETQLQEAQKQIWLWAGGIAVGVFVLSMVGSLAVSVVAALIIWSLTK